MTYPNNPEFITKRPWYLGRADEGPFLDHQANQKEDADALELSLKEAENLVVAERRKLRRARKMQKFQVEMWMEGMKRNWHPYVICQITRIAKKGTVFDLKYEGGTVETNIQMKKKEHGTATARIRITKTGSRSF